jgi:hypothetical protein
VQAVAAPAETRRWTYVYASSPWVYYSISSGQPIEARVLIDAPANSGPCSNTYSLYWKIGQPPTETDFDGREMAYDSFSATRWFSPCNLTGVLFIGIKGVCEPGPGRANFSVWMDTCAFLATTNFMGLLNLNVW